MNLAGHVPWDGCSGCKSCITSPGYPTRLTDFLHCLFHLYKLWGGILFTNEKSKTRKLKLWLKSLSEQQSSDSNAGLASSLNQWIWPQEASGPKPSETRENKDTQGDAGQEPGRHHMFQQISALAGDTWSPDSPTYPRYSRRPMETRCHPGMREEGMKPWSTEFTQT